MVQIGSVLFSFSIATAALPVITGLWGLYKKDRSFLILCKQAVYLHFIVIAAAELILMVLLVQADFSVEYVYSYVNEALPFFYRVTAIWAGHSGSLLFWNFLLILFSVLAIKHIEREEPLLVVPMVIILMSISLFFTLIGNFTKSSDPFVYFTQGGAPFKAPDGRGLNPLLQHWAMIIHPPMLLIGYASFAIPYAIGMASLITKRVNLHWTRLIRRWTLFSWSFLGAGIMLGAKWAYEELGWGGYWAWDPVENASLLPWLSATAFLHSILVQEKREMFKAWNMVLVSISFFLCIFGTFLTRSGIVQSVHAFSSSDLKVIFFIFLIAIVLFSAFWILDRSNFLRSNRPINSFISREAGFLFNNVLLLFMVSVVIIGTMWAYFSELITHTADQKTPVWFNNRMTPLGLILLFLTGAGPLLSWRKTSPKTLLKNFRFPVTAFVLTIIGYGVSIRYIFSPESVFEYKPMAALSFGLSAFIITGVFEEFIRTTFARIRITKESFLGGFIMIFFQNKRRFMGYAVHLGLAFMFIGFTGKAFTEETKLNLAPLESEFYNGYTIKVDKYDKVQSLREGTEIPLYVSDAVGISVYKDNKLVGSSTTELRTYPVYDPASGRYTGSQPTSEPGIIEDGMHDVYVQYGGQADDGRMIIQVWINPLVRWVWFGFSFYSVFLVFLLLPIGEGKTLRIFGQERSVNPAQARST